jgi:hypothetical protein
MIHTKDAKLKTYRIIRNDAVVAQKVMKLVSQIFIAV